MLPSRSYLPLLLALLVALFASTALAADKTKKEERAKKEEGEAVTLDQAPAAVQETIREEVQGGAIKSIHKVTKGKPTFRVDFDHEGTTHRIIVAEDGTLASRREVVQRGEGKKFDR